MYALYLEQHRPPAPIMGKPGDEEEGWGLSSILSMGDIIKTKFLTMITRKMRNSE